MEEKQKFQCNGDCLNCRAVADRKVQWQYCAAQHTYNTMRMIEAMQLSLVSMQGTVNDLSEKIEALQSSEAIAIQTDEDAEMPSSVFDDETTQSGDGVIE